MHIVEIVLICSVVDNTDMCCIVTAVLIEYSEEGKGYAMGFLGSDNMKSNETCKIMIIK